MVSFTVRLKFSRDDRAEVAAMVAHLAAESRREPGCISYIPHQVQDDPDTIVIYEQYRDPQALDAHRATEHFKKYAIGGIFQKMKDRQYENLVALL
jgi:quinol monooxygenase YgiN